MTDLGRTFAGLMIAAALVIGCNNPTTPEGTEGGRCYANNTCNAGLTCVSSVCVVTPAL